MAVKKTTECPHLVATTESALNVANTNCAECGATAPTRVCMTCGHVGCCESSQGHARAHALAAQHPLIRELPARQGSFTWCYDCNAYLQ
ncbi:MAG: UBP-type zinc finger domain-containing protein [Blastocatellia bacterium]